MSRSPLQELARLPEVQAAEFLARLEPWTLDEIRRGEWWWTGRPEQHAPPGNWFVWLIESGRGFGKTRSAAEWLADRMIRFPVDTSGFRTEWLLIAETLPDAVRQCIRGPAGIGRVLTRRLGPEKRNQHDGNGKWRLTRRENKPAIELDDGQICYVEGADDEDVGRGYNASGAWLDEFAKWPKPDGSWLQGVMPSLRADLPGDRPRVIVATTPKLVMQLVNWEDRFESGDRSIFITRGSTYDNASNLSADMLAEFHKAYAGTTLGQQELYGKLIREIAGALWSLKSIEPWRVTVDKLPQMVGRVMAMDAAGTDIKDLCGLVAVGRGEDGEDYVLGDWSKRITGSAAARRAWTMFREYGCDVLLYEDNQGKAFLRDVLRLEFEAMVKEGLFPPGAAPPMRSITAKIGKRLRAEPVAARYEQGRVHHIIDPKTGSSRTPDLETQQLTWVPEKPGDSPDRVDAAVYCVLYNGERERLSAGVVSPLGVTLPNMGTLGPLAGPLPGAGAGY